MRGLTSVGGTQIAASIKAFALRPTGLLAPHELKLRAARSVAQNVYRP